MKRQNKIKSLEEAKQKIVDFKDSNELFDAIEYIAMHKDQLGDEERYYYSLSMASAAALQIVEADDMLIKDPIMTFLFSLLSEKEMNHNEEMKKELLESGKIKKDKNADFRVLEADFNSLLTGLIRILQLLDNSKLDFLLSINMERMVSFKR